MFHVVIERVHAVMIWVTSRVLILFLSTAIFKSTACLANFTINPLTQVVTLQQVAVFNCQHQTADNIGWRVNGTFLSRHQPQGVISHSNGVLSTLNITASIEYNETTIDCVAVFYSEDVFQVSSLAYLYIQGILGAVNDLSVSRMNLFLLISWVAPFTLNLTTVEPDISYCLQICNNSLEEYCHWSLCHIRDTNFVYALQPEDTCHQDTIYITVTPVNAVGKGYTKQFQYQTSSDISVVTHKLNGGNAERMEVMLLIKPESHICRCELLLWNKTARYIFNSTNGLNCSSSNPILEFSTEIIPLNNHYSGRVFILRESIDIHISTHDIQNMVVSDLKNNSLNFVVRYINNTKAKGALITLTPIQVKSMDYTKMMSYRSWTIPVEEMNTTIFKVTTGIYKVLAYDIEHNGLLALPTATPAITSTVLVTGSLLGGINVAVNCRMMNVTTQILPPLLHINCSFNKPFPGQWQGCMVALQSDKYSDTLSTTFRLKGSSTPLVYLIEGERSYTLTVFAMRENSIINQCNSKVELYVDRSTGQNSGLDTYRIVSGIALSVGAMVITTIMTVLVITKVKSKYTSCSGLWNSARKASNPEIKMQECEAYETMQIRNLWYHN